MSLKLSRRSDIETFRVLENLRAVNERVAKGEDIVRLEAGQPCFGAPQAALDHAVRAIAEDARCGYTDALGMVDLRRRIALHYRNYYGVEMNIDGIAVTTGSSSAFIFAFLAAFDAGDRVAITVPTYAAYRNILKSLGLEVVEIPVGAETDYQPTAEILASCGKTFDGLIINSPSNPTGTMIGESELQKICAWCDENDVRLISDEAYHGITYDEKAQTALKYSKDAIVTNTFSKYFAMTGWRLGWLAAAPDVIARVKRLAENLYVSPPTLSQHVAYKIFDHTNELDAYVRHYKRNLEILRKALPDAGLKNLSAAKGGFYIYIDLDGITQDSEGFCRSMSLEARVSATAGVDFDPARGGRTMRISYAGTPQDMEKAASRIKEWLASRR